MLHRHSRYLAVALLTLAAGAGCRRSQRATPDPSPAQRVAIERDSEACVRARAVFDSPAPGDLPEVMVVVRACREAAVLERVIERAWRDARPVGAAMEALYWSSLRIGGQGIFRAALDVARDATRPGPVRLTALRVLAVYIDPQVDFRLPSTGLALPMSVDHPSFNRAAPHDRFAPDSVLAALGQLEMSDVDANVRRSAASIHPWLERRVAAVDVQTGEAERRHRLPAPSAGSGASGLPAVAWADVLLARYLAFRVHGVQVLAAQYRGIESEAYDCVQETFGDDVSMYWLARGEVLGYTRAADTLRARLELLSVAEQVPDGETMYGSIVHARIQTDTLELKLVPDSTRQRWQVCGRLSNDYDLGSYGLPSNVRFSPSTMTRAVLLHQVDSIRRATAPFR